MPFKHGRLAEVLMNANDISGFFHDAELAAKVDTAGVDVFKKLWHEFIIGQNSAQFVIGGYYDPTVNAALRAVLAAANDGILSYAPAGALLIGDQVRLMAFDATDYKEGAKIGGAVALDMTFDSSAPLGYGVSLAPLAAYNVGTFTGTGDAVNRDGSTQTTGGGIGHCHVTAYTSGTQNVKFQDATTQGGAYADIAGGAFPGITAAGGYRLVIPNGTTIRQFVRAVITVAGAQITAAVSFVRT